jgi:hypothetical protein
MLQLLSIGNLKCSIGMFIADLRNSGDVQTCRDWLILKARKSQVTRLTERQKLLLESASDWIQGNYPEADLVGVAWWFLDCGCMAGMGFSLESGIVTPAVRVDRDLVEDGAVSECTECPEDNPTNLKRKFSLGGKLLRCIKRVNFKPRTSPSKKGERAKFSLSRLGQSSALLG